MALNDLDVVYDDKAFGNIIDPIQWNANFKLIETITNSNNIIINEHHVNFSNPHQVTKVQIDLSNVDDTSDLDKPVSTAMLTALNSKVDKVAGKGLSTNDYDNTEKASVASNTTARHTHSNKALLDSYTQIEVNLADAVSKRHTHANTTALNNVSGVNTGDQDLSGYALKTNVLELKATYDPTNKNSDAFAMANMVEGTTNKIFTETERTKLSGIADNANNYTHPTTAGNNHIPTGGASGQVLKYSASGTAVWGTYNDTVYSHPPTHPASMITDLPTGKKVARFVVGTSTAGWTTGDCDYLCDGTADDVEINAVITALPATGGEIVILDGTYNIGAKIDVTKDNVSIRGNGNATILKRMYDSSTAEGVITLTGRSGCKIANLQVDGNKTNYTNYNNSGIYLEGSNNNTVTGNTCNNNNRGIRLSSSSDNTLTGNTCNNNYTGINLNSSSNNNTITGNTCNYNEGNGVYLSSSSNNNTITGNTCNNSEGNGVYISSSSNNNTITGNTCNYNDYGTGISIDSSINNTITGNTCNNSYRGIGLESSSNNNTITGNTCNYNEDAGIYLDSDSSNNTVGSNNCNNNNTGIAVTNACFSNTITGNTCIRGTGLSTDYTASQRTMLIEGSDYNLIAMNNCMGKAVTNEGSTGNTLVNNKFDAS